MGECIKCYAQTHQYKDVVFKLCNRCSHEAKTCAICNKNKTDHGILCCPCVIKQNGKCSNCGLPLSDTGMCQDCEYAGKQYKIVKD